MIASLNKTAGAASLAAMFVLVSCGGGSDATSTATEPAETAAVAPVETEPIITEAPATTNPQPADPTPNVRFAGVIESTSSVSGTLSFMVTESGLIEELALDSVLTDFDCGGGRSITSSGTATHFFADPIAVQGGSFSITSPNLEWSGEFDSATSVHGTIRVAVGDCDNLTPAVSWTAVAAG